MIGRLFPDFVIPGAMKAGTTTLARHLELHPEVAFSVPKEPGILLHRDYKGRNPDFVGPDFTSAEDGFRACLGKARAGQLKVDGTVAYFSAPESPEMCRQLNPDMKAVFLLRDPAKRTRSGFLYSQSIFEENAPTMDAAFEEELRGERDDFWPTLRHLHYSSYPEHLSRWEAALKPGNMLILEFEDFVRAPRDGLDRVCAFLGISPFDTLPAVGQSNVTVTLDTPYKRQIMQLLYTKNPFKSLLKPLLPGRLRQSLKTKVQDSLVAGPQATPEVRAFCKQVMDDRFGGMREELVNRFGFHAQHWASG